MRIAWILTALAATSTACVQGSSALTVGGHTLDPKSGVFWSGLLGATPTTRVVITDQKDVCGLYAALDACSQAAVDATPADGLFLTLTVTGQTPGDYTVAGTDHTRLAEVELAQRSGGSILFSDHAVTGVVTFGDLAAGNGVSGTYALKMQGGDVVQGSFNADACTDLDRLVQRVDAAKLNCATSYSPTTCSASCTCATRASANTADCSRADSSSDWDCTCRRNGDRTKCTAPKSEANVCTQGNGCCDTSF